MNEKVIRQIPVNFANYEKVNSTTSKAKAYILYTGKNRNGSFISKESVEKALPTLYGVPVLGEWKEKGEDSNFGDHGGKVTIDSDGIKFEETTKPYGFLDMSPELANVKWETIEDRDGNEVEYLVADVYLWTGRYPELDVVFSTGANQSMEIEVNEYELMEDKKTYNLVDFNFSALCLLGYSDDEDKNVEPCFENARVVSYSLDKDDFKLQFTQMIKEIKESLVEELKEAGSGAEFQEESTEKEIEQSEEFEAQDDSEKDSEGEESMDEEKEEKFEAKKRKFELSFGDIEQKIYVLLNGYDEDGYMNYEYWICEMFASYAIVRNYEEQEYYKVPYMVEDDNVMIGEKVKVYSVWLTEEEKESLESMKSEYSAYKQAEAEAIEAEINAQKDELFEKYDELMLDNEEYNKIKEAKSDYSLETLESTLAVIYVKSTLNFSSNVKKTNVIKIGSESSDSKPVADPYGGLFAKNKTN